MYALFFTLIFDYNSARCIEINQDLTDLQSHIDCHVFTAHSVYYQS